MTAAISVIVNGVETQLSTLGALVGHVGWGMPVVDTYSRRAPGQHGDTWGGYALAPRIGGLVFRMKQNDLDAMYTLRQTVLNLFSPLAAPILKFVTVEGTRYFQCHYYGDLGLDWGVDDWAAQRFAVALKASDPTCYDPTGVGLTFALGGGTNGAIPSAIPSIIGGDVINQSQVVTYAGSWGSFPFIRITGPITDCIITNTGTSEVLDFTGTTIANLDWYDVDCRYGLKTVKDKAGVNQISKLTAASNLSTFHLAASPEVAGGVNSLLVSGNVITSLTSVAVTYFTRYLGV